MREESTKRSRGIAGSGGFSILELVIVCAVALFLAAIATPAFLRISYNIRLKSAANDVSGVMQRARILAAKNNATYGIAYTAINGAEVACVDTNLNSTCGTGEPLVVFGPTITPAAGAPTGSGGQPSAYILAGDNSTTNYDNATTLAFSPRGLPCAYVSATCSTPAAGYFVYYLNDARPGYTAWAAVVVTRSGRTKTLIWNGVSWD